MRTLERLIIRFKKHFIVQWSHYKVFERLAISFPYSGFLWRLVTNFLPFGPDLADLHI
jgi:hypothetical protein